MIILYNCKYYFTLLIKSFFCLMNYNRTLTLSFGAIGVAALPILFSLPGALFWVILLITVLGWHGYLLFSINNKDQKVVSLPTHFGSPGLLHEFVPTYNVEIDDSMLGNLYEKLLHFFKTEKPYLKSGISIAVIAVSIYSNKTYLSRLLNEKLNQNFNQFVNSYRIKEAQRLVTEEGPIVLTELCKKVGFTSMASFTVAFKLNTGMTPGEWCKKQKHLS